MAFIKYFIFFCLGMAMVCSFEDSRSPDHLYPCWNEVFCRKVNLDKMTECTDFLDPKEDIQVILEILAKTVKTEEMGVEPQTEAYCALGTDDEKKPQFDEMAINALEQYTKTCSDFSTALACNRWSMGMDCGTQLLDSMHDEGLC